MEYNNRISRYLLKQKKIPFSFGIIFGFSRWERHLSFHIFRCSSCIKRTACSWRRIIYYCLLRQAKSSQLLAYRGLDLEPYIFVLSPILYYRKASLTSQNSMKTFFLIKKLKKTQKYRNRIFKFCHFAFLIWRLQNNLHQWAFSFKLYLCSQLVR